jgi:hypothetical protein
VVHVVEMFEKRQDEASQSNKQEIVACLKQSKYKVRPNSSRIQSTQ